MKRFWKFALVALCAISFASCSDDDKKDGCKKAGESCGKDKICNEALKCVAKPADLCAGKTAGEACGQTNEHKICAANGECVLDETYCDEGWIGCNGKVKQNCVDHKKVNQADSVDCGAKEVCYIKGEGNAKAHACGSDCSEAAQVNAICDNNKLCKAKGTSTTEWECTNACVSASTKKFCSLDKQLVACTEDKFVITACAAVDSVAQECKAAASETADAACGAVEVTNLCTGKDLHFACETGKFCEVKTGSELECTDACVTGDSFKKFCDGKKIVSCGSNSKLTSADCEKIDNKDAECKDGAAGASATCAVPEVNPCAGKLADAVCDEDLNLLCVAAEVGPCTKHGADWCETAGIKCDGRKKISCSAKHVETTVECSTDEVCFKNETVAASPVLECKVSACSEGNENRYCDAGKYCREVSEALTCVDSCVVADFKAFCNGKKIVTCDAEKFKTADCAEGKECQAVEDAASECKDIVAPL